MNYCRRTASRTAAKVATGCVVALALLLSLTPRSGADVEKGSVTALVESDLLYPGDTEEVFFNIDNLHDWIKFRYKGPRYSLAAVITPSLEVYEFFGSGKRRVVRPETGEYSVLFVAPPPSVAKKPRVFRLKVQIPKP